ncbi:MAG: hypothetical protein PVJ98_02120 [Akkermansiaceae bacterium]
MKLLFALLPSFLLLACGPINPVEEDPEPEKKVGPPRPVELPVEQPDDGLSFADPNTTENLMGEEDKKTVVGPTVVTPPEPPADSTIEVPTPPAPE